MAASNVSIVVLYDQNGAGHPVPVARTSNPSLIAAVAKHVLQSAQERAKTGASDARDLRKVLAPALRNNRLARPGI
jgi:hypothetical protein